MQQDLVAIHRNLKELAIAQVHRFDNLKKSLNEVGCLKEFEMLNVMLLVLNVYKCE